MLDAMENVIIDNTREFDSDPSKMDMFDRENRILEAIEFYYQRMFSALINGQVNGATAGCLETLLNAAIELINFIDNIRNGVDIRIAFRFITVEEVRRQELISMIKKGVQNKDTMEAILKCFSMINGCVRHREDVSLYREETQKRVIGLKSLELHRRNAENINRIIEKLLPDLHSRFDATLQSFEFLAWNGVAKNILQNVEQISQNLTEIDCATRGMLNVIGALVMVCLRKLGDLEGSMEGMCLFLKGFVDWKVDLRNMLEEVYIRNVEGEPVIDKNAEKHVAVINAKLEELIDGV
jgi:hypothetical protein